MTGFITKLLYILLYLYITGETPASHMQRPKNKETASRDIPYHVSVALSPPLEGRWGLGGGKVWIGGFFTLLLRRQLSQLKGWGLAIGWPLGCCAGPFHLRFSKAPSYCWIWACCCWEEGAGLRGAGQILPRDFQSEIYSKGTSDFDAQMCGIKFWKGFKNLKHVHKKPFYKNIEWLLAFWTF